MTRSVLRGAVRPADGRSWPSVAPRPWRRLLGRLGRLLASLVMAGGLLLGVSAGQAHAAGSSWWLPSDWVSVSSGTVGAVRSYLTGVGGTVSNAPALDLESTWVGTGSQKVSVRVVGLTASGLPKLQYAVTNYAGVWPADGEPWGKYNATTSGNLTCIDGYSQAIGGWTAEGAPNISAPCSVHGGVRSVWFHRSGFADSSRSWQWWTWNAGVDALVTTVTCRDLTTGQDSTLTETSTSGVAAAPVCPAGSVAVRVRIVQGSSVLQDASITNGALSTYGQYLGDPGGWDWRTRSETDCYLQRSSDPTMVIALSVGVCREVAQEGQGTGDDPSGCAADDVVCAIREEAGKLARILTGIADSTRRVIEAVRDLQTGVREDLGEIKGKLTDQGGGEGDPGDTGPTGSPCQSGQQLANAANPVEWVQRGVECALTPNEEGIADKWDRIQGGIGEPLAPWQDALGGVAEAWAMTPGSCQGPALVMPLGEPVGTFTLHPLDACTEPMATLAQIARLVGTVLMLSAAAWAAAGAIAAGLGYSGGGS